MKRKSILLLILPALMLLMACGGEDETGLDSMSTPIPTDTPDLNATIEAKVQSLEQDIAALKEQVAQAQAVNKELEGEIAALKASAVSTPTQTPIPPEPPAPEAPPERPIETTTPTSFPEDTAWINPMTIDHDVYSYKYTTQGIEQTFQHILVVVNNSNSIAGEIVYDLQAFDKDGIKLTDYSQWTTIKSPDGLRNLRDTLAPNSTSHAAYRFSYAIGEPVPHEWTIDVNQNSRRDLPIFRFIDNEGGVTGERTRLWYQRGESIEDPREQSNWYFEVEGAWLTNKTSGNLEISYYMNTYSLLEYVELENKGELHFEKFPNMPYYLNNHQFIKMILEPNSKTQAQGLGRDNDCYYEKCRPDGGNYIKLHSWKVLSCKGACWDTYPVPEDFLERSTTAPTPTLPTEGP